MELNIENLERCFKAAEKDHAVWIAIQVKAKTTAPELIINPQVNFAQKLEYYKTAYNADLTLKSCPDIRITGFTYGYTLSDIGQQMYWEVS